MSRRASSASKSAARTASTKRRKATSISINVRIARHGHKTDVTNPQATPEMLEDAEQLVDFMSYGVRQGIPGLGLERLRELAGEAAQCIAVNRLDEEEEIYAYLEPFLREVLEEAANPKKRKATR